MEPIRSYLTKEGWERDLQKTREDFSNIKLSRLDDVIRDDRGNVAVGVAGVLTALVATPFCAYALSYVGEGAGWVVGNIIDFIPYVKDVAPWLAERAGLINDAKTAVDLNENIYQTAGAIEGFWAGLALPWCVLSAFYKRK